MLFSADMNITSTFTERWHLCRINGVNLMSSKYCENCNNRISNTDTKKCPKCGALLKERMNAGQDKMAFIGFIVAIIMVLMVLTGRLSDFTDEKIEPKGQPEKEGSFAQPPESQVEDNLAAVQEKNEQPSDYTKEIGLNYLELEEVRPGKKADIVTETINKSELSGEVASKNAAVNAKKSKIATLEREVRAVPMSRVSENLRIYKQLLTLDPENLRYKKKVAYYEMKQKKKDSSQGRREEFVIISESKPASVLSYPIKGAYLGTIPAGKKLRILEKQVSKKGKSTQVWFRVAFNESYGWINQNDTDGEVKTETVIAEKLRKN